MAKKKVKKTKGNKKKTGQPKKPKVVNNNEDIVSGDHEDHENQKNKDCKLILLGSENAENSYDKISTPLDLIKVDNLSQTQRLTDLRKAAVIHKAVRKNLQSVLKPGMKLTDICNTVENKIVELVGYNNFRGGIGFPTGVSINHIAAHDSANPGDTRVLGYNDVCKIDFGTHYNGQIIDCAFTAAFNPKYEPLLRATKEATCEGIKMAGPDVRLIEISKVTQEVIESHEIDIKEDGNLVPIYAVNNLGGHNIEPYRIHGGKLILCTPEGMKMYGDTRMQAGECYAIETFATTGDPALKLDESMECNHFMKKFDANRSYNDLKLNASRKVLTYINKERGTLPFCSRWVNDSKYVEKSWRVGISDLCKQGIVEPYYPIVDKVGEYTSQFEHTFFVHENGKEVLSASDDF